MGRLGGAGISATSGHQARSEAGDSGWCLSGRVPLGPAPGRCAAHEAGAGLDGLASPLAPWSGRAVDAVEQPGNVVLAFAQLDSFGRGK